MTVWGSFQVFFDHDLGILSFHITRTLPWLSLNRKLAFPESQPKPAQKTECRSPGGVTAGDGGRGEQAVWAPAALGLRAPSRLRLSPGPRNRVTVTLGNECVVSLGRNTVAVAAASKVEPCMVAAASAAVRALRLCLLSCSVAVRPLRGAPRAR